MFCSILVPGEQFPHKASLYSLFSESARQNRAKIRKCSEEPVHISVLAKQTDCVGTQSCVSTGSAMVMPVPYCSYSTSGLLVEEFHLWTC